MAPFSLNHACTLCGSREWPDPESACSLCYGEPDEDDRDHDSHNDERYDEPNELHPH